MNQYRVRRGSVADGAWFSKGAVWFSSVCSVAKKGAAWLSEGGAWLSSGCSIVQFRVQCGSVRVPCGSVQGAAWLSTGCSMVQLKGAALLS